MNNGKRRIDSSVGLTHQMSVQPPLCNVVVDCKDMTSPLRSASQATYDCQMPFKRLSTENKSSMY